MSNLDLSRHFSQFLHDRVSSIAMRAIQVFAGLFENLLEGLQSLDVLVLQFLHPLQCCLEVLAGQEHVVAILAHHLQDLYEMLEETDVVYGEVKLHVAEMPDTALESLAAGQASQ